MLRRLLDLFLSRFPNIFWSYRHLWDPRWADVYTSNAAVLHPHRLLLSDSVGMLTGDRTSPTSILEYGCGGGANLLWFAIDFPEAKVYGYDISKRARTVAKKFLKDYRKVAILDQEDEIDARMYDVIITDATLIYFNWDKAEAIIKKFKDLASVGIVLCEWSIRNYPFRSFLHEAHWVHDYVRLLGPDTKLVKIGREVWPSGGWQKHGYIISWAKRPN